MKDPKDLAHVTGVINQHRTIRHFNNPVGNKGLQTVTNIVVIKIAGDNNEFGITQASKEIREIIENKNGLMADIYFNSEGKRIEENVIADILNLSLDNKNYINIEDIKSRAGKEATILLMAGAVLIIIALAAFIKLIRMKTNN